MRDTLCKHLCCPDSSRPAHYLRRDEVESWLDYAALVDGRVTWIHRTSWAAAA